MEDKTNVIKIQRYHSPCGDLMLGSLEDKLCLCDWAAESGKTYPSIQSPIIFYT